MTQPAAILATFAGFNKPVIGRRVVPLVFEVPIEQFQSALAILGTPDAANPKWCGIALTELAGGVSNGALPVSRVSEAPPAKPNSTRAVMMAKDQEFWKYTGAVNEEEANAYLKEVCQVTSRRELNDGPGAVEFARMREAFKSWRLSIPVPRANG